MHNILILGAGKVGSLVSYMLAESNDYNVHLVDLSFSGITHEMAAGFSNITLQEIDCSQKTKLINYIEANKIATIASCLPYYCNVVIAEIACESGLNYFDLTEDVAVSDKVKELSHDSSGYFVGQCGLAPGFISIVTNNLIQEFDEVESVKMRVGALPVNVSNALQYALTWSTEGLINEYSNKCSALDNGDIVSRYPLEGLEEIKIDGLTYEAFNTSGGVGSLVNSSLGKIKNMNYKTIRYPGHCDKIKFLMHELRLGQSRSLLQDVLETAVPQMSQDVVLVFVAVQGKKNGSLIEKNYTKKFYPKTIDSYQWSAVQMSTASSLCALIDLVIGGHVKPDSNFVRQELIKFNDFIDNRFGAYFA